MRDICEKLQHDTAPREFLQPQAYRLKANCGMEIDALGVGEQQLLRWFFGNYSFGDFVGIVIINIHACSRYDPQYLFKIRCARHSVHNTMLLCTKS